MYTNIIKDLLSLEVLLNIKRFRRKAIEEEGAGREDYRADNIDSEVDLRNGLENSWHGMNMIASIVLKKSIDDNTIIKK